MLPQSLNSYAEYVRQNKNKHCKETIQLVDMVEKSYNQSLDKTTNIVYDETEPNKIVKFCEKLCINLEGKKLVLLEWQKFLIYSVFGFYKKDEKNELRILHNQIFLLIGKKNGKSSLSSALLLYYIITKPNSMSILVACDYTQATINFNYILDFIRFTPELRAALDAGILYAKERAPQTLVSKEICSRLLIIPETKKQAAQGQKPTFIIFDEIASYRSSEIIQKLSTGMIDKNAISFSLTTGEKSINNPAYSELARAQNVLSGKFLSTNYLPFVYKLDDNDKWDNTEVYIKANPSLGITKSKEKLIEDLAEAKQKEINQASFKAYHLNMFFANEQLGIKDNDWNKAITNVKKYSDYIKEDKLKTYTSYLALDLSKVDDISALTQYFFIPEISKYYAKHFFYIPRDTLEERFSKETEQYYIWIKNKIITQTVGKTVDYDYIKQDILKLASTYPKLVGLGYDAYSAYKLIEKLESENNRLIYSPVNQSYKVLGLMNKEWYEAVLNGNIIDDNSFMNYCRSNAKFVVDNNHNLRFEKEDYFQSTKRIDGVDTSVMSYGLLSNFIKDNANTFDAAEWENMVNDLPDLY